MIEPDRPQILINAVSEKCRDFWQAWKWFSFRVEAWPSEMSFVRLSALMSTTSRAYAFAGVQAEKAPMNHKAAKPNEANDAGRRTGPFPISDRTRASIDPTNPNGTSESSGGPLLRAFLSITTSTKNPAKEARTKPLNTLIFLQSEKGLAVCILRSQSER